MNRKDVALTVGGVLATMVLAYLLYRLQQRDAAAAVANQDTSSAGTPSANDAYLLQYAEQLPDITTSVVTGTTGDTTGTEATSGATADLGVSVDSTATNQLLDNIVAAFSGSLSTSTLSPAQIEAMTVPAIAGVTQTSLDGIPVTAQDAAAQAVQAISPSVSTFDSSTAAYLPAMESSALVTSHPVQAHPIVSVGS